MPGMTCLAAWASVGRERNGTRPPAEIPDKSCTNLRRDHVIDEDREFDPCNLSIVFSPQLKGDQIVLLEAGHSDRGLSSLLRHGMFVPREVNRAQHLPL